MRGAHALCLCAVALSLGCYAFVPATLDAVPAGASVRALLSTEAQLALRDSVGLRQQTVQATLVDRGEDRVLLAVRAEDDAWRVGSRALYQRVTLAPRDVLQVEMKRLDRGRTAGLLGALAVVATVGVIQAFRKGNPGTPGPPGGGPPD